MDDEKFEALINDAMDNNDRELSTTTRLQYASQLRDFNRKLKSAHPARAATEDLDTYVSSLTSLWARRRAVSSLRMLYRFLDRETIADALLMNGYGRPPRTDFESLAERLQSRGWTMSALRSLRWDHVHGTLLQKGNYKFRGKTLALTTRDLGDFRALLCRRYPRSTYLFGKSPPASRVFRLTDIG